MPYNTKHQVIEKLKEIFDKFTPRGGKPIYTQEETQAGDSIFWILVKTPDNHYYGLVAIIIRDYDLIFRYSHDNGEYPPIIGAYDVLTKYKFLSIQKIDSTNEKGMAGLFDTYDVHYLELTANDGELLSRWPFYVTIPENRPQDRQNA